MSVFGTQNQNNAYCKKKGVSMTDETKMILDKLNGIDAKLTNFEEKTTEVQMTLDKLNGIDARLTNLEEKTTEVQMTLENETNKNIKIIAEGHLDLSRKLDEALKVESEKEMLLLRVNWLENETRRIKKRIGRGNV